MNEEYPFQMVHYTTAMRQIQSNITNTDLSNICRMLLGHWNMEILGYNEHIFSNGSITFTFLLGTSHLSCHTWSESNSFFLDFATCHQNPNMMAFHNRLLNIVNPTTYTFDIVKRD
jgi:S-adenosylmethionine/arginine decarboxylase-like enzyme